jgi:hypothetical protein
MARESTSQLNIPSKGSESVPYPTHREIVQGLLKHNAELFAAEVVGAGGAGGSFVCPFEPGVLVMSEATGPLLQLMLPGSAGQVDINAITGAAAAAAPVITAVDADDKSQGFTVALPTGIAPDGDTVSVLAIGFRDTDGSL